MDRQPYRTELSKVLEHLYGAKAFSDMMPESQHPEFQGMVARIAEQNSHGLEVWLSNYAQTLLKQNRTENYSQFSRIALKRLCLHRIPAADGKVSDAFIETTYQAHLNACRFFFETHPPQDIPRIATNRLNQALDAIVSPGPVILTMVTRNYLKNLSLWLRCSEQSGQTAIPTVLICLDDCAKEARLLCDESRLKIHVVDLGLSQAAKVGNGASLSFIWYYKVLALRMLLMRGIGVIYSDLDSFWIGDVEGYIKEVCNSSNAWPDVMFMTTDNMPMISKIRFGVTAGCGFVILQATPRAEAFVEAWLSKTAQMLDDQIGLFETISSAGTKWSKSDDQEIPFICNYPLEGPIENVVLGIMPTSRVLRVASVKALSTLPSKPLVIHPRWIVDTEVTEEQYLLALSGN